jgi:hypothetical protein
MGDIEELVSETLLCAANGSSEIQAIAGRILTIIQQRPSVDLVQLRVFILKHGLPPHAFCSPRLRAIVWKLLLGVLPPERENWPSYLESQRNLYNQYVYELIHEPELITNLRYGTNTPSPVARENLAVSIADTREDALNDDTRGPVARIYTDDHPLAHSASWHRFWVDSEIFDSVNKDVFRTRLDMNFFFSDIPETTAVRGRCLTESVIVHVPTSPKNHAFMVANIVSPKTHYDRLCRILFLYSKLNFGYVQGMNEIIAVIYFTIWESAARGSTSSELAHVEADTFLIFTAIMQEHRDIFCKTLDDCNSGMLGRLHVLGQLLAEEDPQVSTHLEELGIKMDFFAVPWITLLLASEFDIQSVQVIWDSLLSDQGTNTSQRYSLLHYLCVAMIIRVRDVLLNGDFTDCMNILQRYPPFDVQQLVTAALRLKHAKISPLQSSDDLSAVRERNADETPTSNFRNFIYLVKRKLQRNRN